MVGLQTKVRPRDDVLLAPVAGEMVLLSLETEEYLGLDEVGSRLWEVLSEADSIEAACQQFVSEYDVELDVIRQDALDFVTQLHESKLVELVE